MRKFMFSLLAVSLPFCITATSALAEEASATKLTKNPISVPGHLAPVYGFAGAEVPIEDAQDQSEAPEIKSLGILPTSSPGTQIGFTTYDMQHNCTMGRQIEHRGSDFLSMSFMLKSNSVLGGDRDIVHVPIRLSDCNPYFGAYVNDTRAGYTAIDVDPSTGCPIVTGHEAFTGEYYPTVYFDFLCPPVPLFPSFMPNYPSDNFGWWLTPGTGPGNENIWPKIEWHIGTQTVLHMVAAEFGGTADDPQTISYYRKVYDEYNDDGGNAWSEQHVIDTVTSINVTIASSPTSDSVAIVWAAPCDYKRDTPDEFTSQYTNDIWYAMSPSQGSDWPGSALYSIAWLVDALGTPGGNITNYGANAPYKAYCDLSAVFDDQNGLQIVWNARHWSNSGNDLDLRNSALYHWTYSTGNITPVVVANWDDGVGKGHAWGSDVAKPSISVCNGDLYVLYTQFGNAAEPSTDRDATNGLMNGELYLTYSKDGGTTWETPENLTNSETPGCTAGNCDSDYWASMVRYGRPANGCGGGDNVPTEGHVLDILYINDKEPGAVVQPESGTWTANPILWLTVPCKGSIITGACCFDDGSCVEMTVEDCELGEGTYHGDGSVCAGDNDGNNVDDRCEAWQIGDDHKMHFPQLPDTAGWDVYSSGLLTGYHIADDWMCSGTGWVKDFHFWGSWLNGVQEPLPAFVINIFTDVPAVTDQPYSHPGDNLHTIQADSFTIVEMHHETYEGWYNPFYGDTLYDNHQTYYQYDIHLDSTDWFWQDSGTVYWVTIYPLTFTQNWGWKSSLDHWNDQAVYKASGGDWLPLYEPGTYIPGDVDHDGDVDMDDYDWLESYVNLGSPQPVYDYGGFYPAADVSGDCEIDNSDVYYLYEYLNFTPILFASPCGPEPREPLDLSFVITAGPFACGDANGDGTINVGDAVHLINFVFKNGPPPTPYDAGDVNCDGVVNVGDAVWVINYVFKSGPAPCECP